MKKISALFTAVLCMVLLAGVPVVQVHASAPAAPVYTGASGDVKVEKGTTDFHVWATFEAEAGCSLQYQWYRTTINDISTIKAILGKNSHLCTIDASSAGTAYYCLGAWAVNDATGEQSTPSYSRLIKVEVYEEEFEVGSITVTQLPDKTTYLYGDMLDLKGLKLLCYTTKGYMESVNGGALPNGMVPSITMGPFTKVSDNTEISVWLGGASTTFKVKVKGFTLVDNGGPDDVYAPAGGEKKILWANFDSPEGADLEYEWYWSDTPDYDSMKSYWGVVSKGAITSNAEGIKYYAVKVNAVNNGYHLVSPKWSRIIKVEYYDPAKTKHEHTFGGWTMVKQPGCETEGLKERYCACGEKESQTIPASGHELDEGVVTKEATTEEEGVMTYTCKRCGAVTTHPIPRIKGGSDPEPSPSPSPAPTPDPAPTPAPAKEFPIIPLLLGLIAILVAALIGVIIHIRKK